MTDKIDIIEGAYSQMRISGITVDPSPEDIETALQRLEDMMAEFDSNDVCVNYNFEDEPNPNSPTNVERGFKLMMKTNLAVQLVPDFNKTVPPILYNRASASYSNMLSVLASRNARQTPYPTRQPIGNANSIRYNNWRRYYPPTAILRGRCKDQTMKQDEINDFTEDFTAYLGSEDIQTYTITATDGLTIVSHSNDTNTVFYRIKAIGRNENSRNLEQVNISITTTTGRVEERIILFEVTHQR